MPHLIRLLLVVVLLGLPHIGSGDTVIGITPAHADDNGDNGDDGDDGDDGDSDDGPDAVGGGGDDGPDAVGGTDERGGGQAPSGRSGGSGGEIEELFDSIFGDGTDNFVEDEIIGVGLAPPGRAALIAAGFQVLSESPLTSLGGALTILSAPSGLDAQEALEVARGLVPNTVFDLNHLYDAGGTGCEGDACWGARLVGLGSLPDGACTRGAPIAMIDTAVQTQSPALAGARVETQNFVRPEISPAPSDHGTAIATLMVGRIAPDARPLAPGARLLAASVFGMRDGAPLAEAATIIRGIDWAVGRGARVIAFSFEGAANEVLQVGVRRAAQSANLVAAAGNGGPGGDSAYPAAYPEVMAVAAVDRRFRPYSQGTRGGYVEIAAPGVNVLSVGGGGGQRSYTGSSFAVPFVAAALLRARAQTGGNAPAARGLITGSAHDLGAPGRDEIFGYGLLSFEGDRCL